jgi:hypothetical protein
VSEPADGLKALNAFEATAWEPLDLAEFLQVWYWYQNQ